MRDTLYFAGFDDVRHCELGKSDDPVLRGVEGHSKVIGEKFNRIESCTHEARKAGRVISTPKITPAETVAVILGGAINWKEDLEKAKKVIGVRHIRYFLINDQIKTFPEEGVAVTLHPDKLSGQFAWLRVRRENGHPEPEQVWAHRHHELVTNHNDNKDWGGSTGLFAVMIAIKEGHQKVIACGIPMTVDDSHYIRHQKWQSAIAFRPSWIKCRNDLAPHFRSMSGWTKEQFGEPTEEWLGL
jgi:hypothetical protein